MSPFALRESNAKDTVREDVPGGGLVISGSGFAGLCRFLPTVKRHMLG